MRRSFYHSLLILLAKIEIFKKVNVFIRVPKRFNSLLLKLYFWLIIGQFKKKFVSLLVGFLETWYRIDQTHQVIHWKNYDCSRSNEFEFQIKSQIARDISAVFIQKRQSGDETRFFGDPHNNQDRLSLFVTATLHLAAELIRGTI